MQTVGEILRSAREKKGLSIKDIEQDTSIRALYIKAIEDNDYKVVPGEVYLKGFIRNYASYLGLDAQAIMDVYRENQNPAEVIRQEKVQEVSTASAAEVSYKNPEASERAGAKSSGYGKVVVALLVVAAAGGAFWWFSGTGQTPVKETKPAPTVPVTPSKPETKPAPVPPAVPVPQGKPVVITAKFTANCWTLVMADGKEVYQGIPKVGETITWEAQKDIVVKAGNAGAVELTYNGQPVGKIGEIGEVVEKTFSAKM